MPLRIPRALLSISLHRVSNFLRFSYFLVDQRKQVRARVNIIFIGAAHPPTHGRSTAPLRPNGTTICRSWPNPIDRSRRSRTDVGFAIAIPRSCRTKKEKAKRKEGKTFESNNSRFPSIEIRACNLYAGARAYACIRTSVCNTSSDPPCLYASDIVLGLFIAASHTELFVLKDKDS